MFNTTFYRPQTAELSSPMFFPTTGYSPDSWRPAISVPTLDDVLNVLAVSSLPAKDLIPVRAASEPSLQKPKINIILWIGIFLLGYVILRKIL